MLAVAFGLTSPKELGAAHADSPVLAVVADAGVPVDAAIPLPPATGETTVTTTTITSATLHDPTVDPLAAVDDVRAAKRHGWPAAVLAGSIMLALALRTAGKKWPTQRWILWLNTGKRAFVIAAVISVGSACFDAVVLGGTLMAIAFAGAFAFFALMNSSESKPA